MKYSDLIESHLKYGTTKEDIINNKGFEKVLENVIVAPWWSHSIFENKNLKIEKINDKLYNMYGDNFSFSFIELKLIGASSIMEAILPLGLTKCKKIIFIGSVGSLDEDIKIGDIVVPSYSICGDGASRYLNKDLSDEFGKKQYPYGNLSDKVINVCNRLGHRVLSVPNYSVDTIFAQYNFIDYIRNTGAKTIEMETALLFKSSNLMKIDTTAILCVSDNVCVNKSLYSGRTEKDNEYRHMVRDQIIPNIVIELLNSM